MTNIILCGGSGTRLWPISRSLLPKQFVKMFDNYSLFQLTLQRNTQFDKHLVVSNSDQYFLAIDQIESLKEKYDIQYLLEPVARNTAPAIALACLSLSKEELVLITPSDHLIKNELEYNKILKSAQELAEKDYLVTFGIKPTYPETGYGYIEAKDYDVKDFHEKPNIGTAKQYLKAGNYYWNSGMFCFKAGVFLEELKKYSPEIYKESIKAFNNAKCNGMIRIQHMDMLEIPEESIDYAVMEKSQKVKVVPSDIDWSDLGSFDSLYEELSKDSYGNTLNENHISIDSKNNLIYGNERKIATVDIEDTIIVDTGDALLISKKGSSQKVKEVVKEVKKNSELHNIHVTGHRPWGIYKVLEDSPGYKIKKIKVKSKKRLSLQSHKYRNEHWVVVSGQATITLNNETFILNENESTYIKAGDKHRLANETNDELIIIEAQVGSYTGEDDIIRYEDDFKREK